MCVHICESSVTLISIVVMEAPFQQNLVLFLSKALTQVVHELCLEMNYMSQAWNINIISKHNLDLDSIIPFCLSFNNLLNSIFSARVPLRLVHLEFCRKPETKECIFSKNI